MNIISFSDKIIAKYCDDNLTVNFVVWRQKGDIPIPVGKGSRFTPTQRITHNKKKITELKKRRTNADKEGKSNIDKEIARREKHVKAVKEKNIDKNGKVVKPEKVVATVSNVKKSLVKIGPISKIETRTHRKGEYRPRPTQSAKRLTPGYEVRKDPVYDGIRVSYTGKESYPKMWNKALGHLQKEGFDAKLESVGVIVK